jgi:ABC-type uncharacterized transport system permease subunit
VAAVIGGGLAGIAGAFQVMGVQLRLTPDFLSSKVAFTGVLVALLGGCRPIGVLVAGLFMGALTNGGAVVQQATNAPSVMVYVLEALVLLFILTGLQWASRGGLTGLRELLRRTTARRAATRPGPGSTPNVPPISGETAPSGNAPAESGPRPGMYQG